MKQLLLVFTFSLILSGCFGVGSNKGPKADGEFVQGQVVEGFPSLPAYQGAQIVESYGMDGKFGLSLITEDELSKVVNYFGPALTQLGWRNSLKQNSSDNFEYEISSDEYDGNLVINRAADGESTAISVSVEPR